MTVLIRASPGTDVVRPGCNAFVRSLDPALPANPAKSAEGIIFRSAIEAPRFTMLLLTIFTALALALAAVGLYGVMAYSVAQRTREIGIRMALGASRGAIARVVIVRGVTLAVLGAAVGLSGAYWATRLVRNLLYGVAPLDLASFAIGAAVLIGRPSLRAWCRRGGRWRSIRFLRYERRESGCECTPLGAESYDEWRRMLRMQWMLRIQHDFGVRMVGDGAPGAVRRLGHRRTASMRTRLRPATPKRYPKNRGIRFIRRPLRRNSLPCHRPATNRRYRAAAGCVPTLRAQRASATALPSP